MARQAERETKEMGNELTTKIPPTRLFSALDYHKGMLNLAVLETEKSEIQSMADYKATHIALNVDQIHFKDKLSLHRQVTEVLHRDVTKTHASMKKMQETLTNVDRQLKQERIVTTARNNKIKDLEQKKLIQLASRPYDAEQTNKMIEDKNT